MTASQQTYYHVYRNRQSWMHHIAYMRLSKVFAVRYALQRQNFALDGKRVFDYGFGAGTFFRHCPRSAFLHGVELDRVLVEQVTAALCAKKYAHVDLRVVDEARPLENELLRGRYDLVVVSHVLEHVKVPVELLDRLVACVRPGGCLVAVVPVNERVKHNSHERVVNEPLMREWAAAVRALIVDRFEFDRFTQRALPVFEKKTSGGRIAAQALSVALGLCATVGGMRAWLSLDRFAGKILRAVPGQAVYVLKPSGEMK